MLVIPTHGWGDPDYKQMQKKIFYLTSKGKKYGLKPAEAKEVRFKIVSSKGKSTTIRMLSRVPRMSLNRLDVTELAFVKLEQDGFVKVFKYWGGERFTSQIGPPSWKQIYFYQKGNTKLKRIKELSFKKNMSEYFNDCSSLVKKINDLDYTYQEMRQVATYFNTNCK